MGCDIHMLAEVRREGVWQKVGKVFPYAYYRPEQPTGEWSCYEANGEKAAQPHADDAHTAECWEHNPMLSDQPYQQRNYMLFSVLADCGRGPFQPIVANRGIPSDASPEYRAFSDRMGVDGHSHSWLTLAELLAFDWKGATATMGGVVSEREYVRSLRTGEHQTWSRSIMGKNIVVLGPEAYEEMIGGGTFDGPGSRDPSKDYYIQASWSANPIDYTADFREQTLARLGELGEPADVRIVYFFDN